MGKKYEKGTPKELANRTKSKGLQKLRFYCEMCKKQCRDANGYKCHLTSESHQRQLLLVAEDTEKYVREFSREFENNFLQILKNQFGTRRVLANEVYQEIIREKGHVHMNSTRWHSLSGFVQHLGATDKCKIDKHDEKGWFIQLIDHEAALKKEELERKAKAEKDDEERQQELINQQVQRALELQGDNAQEYRASNLIRADENEKIALSINFNRKPTLEELNKPSTSFVGSVFDKPKVKKEERDCDKAKDRDRNLEQRREREHKRDRRSRSRSRERFRDRKEEKPKKSALDEIKEMNERKKELNNRKDHWLHEGIIVKIVTKKLGSDFYKAKGVVKSLINEYTGSVKLDDGTLVKLDQDHVETVIPQVGRDMLIVNGAYRGMKAELLSIDSEKFMLNLKINAGLMNGRTVKVPYEDASKLAV